MANLCSNQLRVRGPEDDIARFVEGAVAQNEAEELVFGEFTGFIRSTQNRQTEIAFVSEHNPPLRFLADLSRQFPTLTFYVEWEEGGVGLSGSCFIFGGEGDAVEEGFFHGRWRIPDEFPETEPERAVEESPTGDEEFRGTFLDPNPRSSTRGRVRWQQHGF
jgi:hypothetical protein